MFFGLSKNIINFRKIWVERSATERNRLIAVMLSDQREDGILVQRSRREKFRVASPPRLEPEQKGLFQVLRISTQRDKTPSAAKRSASIQFCF